MKNTKSCLGCVINIMDTMSDLYAVCEVVYGNNDQLAYKFIKVSSELEMVMGLGNIDGKHFNEIFDDTVFNYNDKFKNIIITGHSNELEIIYNDKCYMIKAFTPKYDILIITFTDITKIKKADETLTKHKLLFECAKDAVMYVKSNGTIIDANNAAYKMYGYDGNEMINLSIHDIRHSSTRFLFEEQMKEADDKGILFETLHVKKDGSSFPVEVSVRGMLINDEIIRIHIVRDITRRKANEEKIMYLANYDSLTGIPNRAKLMNEINMEIERAHRGKYKFALLFFDIDKFKSINDLHGHYAGDVVLKTVASRVQDIIRKVDMLGRFGGDEFVMLLPLYDNNTDSVLNVLYRIFDVINKPIKIDDTELNVNISVGISIYPDNAINRRNLLKIADEAMYIAKKDKGNSYMLGI